MNDSMPNNVGGWTRKMDVLAASMRMMGSMRNNIKPPDCPPSFIRTTSNKYVCRKVWPVSTFLLGAFRNVIAQNDEIPAEPSPPFRPRLYIYSTATANNKKRKLLRRVRNSRLFLFFHSISLCELLGLDGRSKVAL
jgi:hypothetical protein